MQKSEAELKGNTIYSPYNMKRTRIFGTHAEVEVVLHNPIDDVLFQPGPKLTRPLFRFRVSCTEWAVDVPAQKCVMMDVGVVVMSTTLCHLTERTLDQLNKIAKYMFDGTIDLSSLAYSRCCLLFSSARHDEWKSAGLT